MFEASIVDVVIEVAKGARHLAFELLAVDGEVGFFHRVGAEDLFLVQTDDAERVAGFRFVAAVTLHGAP